MKNARAWGKRLLWWWFWATVSLLCLAAGVGIWMQREHLVLNQSTCEPLGLYRLIGNPYPLHDGELVEVELPDPITHPAVAEGLRDHWFPQNQPWIKQIGALPGQTVTLSRQGVWVDGRYLPNSRVNRRTPGGRSAIIHYPFGTYHLKSGQVWLYAPGNYAFDSSYYGPVSQGHILQAAQPYWIIPGSQFWLQKGD
ncbi:MAG: S26 family signal peptidase [Acidithiobacillus caldus]|uniref:S26 family signal peptidase n=1 Tax=Acidithiobacillus caldus TaxID=33059 RepID=UPI002276AF97|nr:S26 family signal peptidase [Acidithiobacillus caldus]